MLTAPPVLARAWLRVVGWLEALQPLAQLAARLYIARVFFLSGLTKTRDWETTLALFSDEYHVPLLPPEVAAVAGTTGELVLPVLLAVGLAGRFGAMGLFVLNIVAAISLADIADAALQQHVFWGSLLAGLILWGPGRWSVDHFVAPRLLGQAPSRRPMTVTTSGSAGS
jgi:putative oxidoreductase